MATEKLEIQVSADVNRAVAGINNLNKSLKQTAASTAPLVKGTNSAAFALTNLGRVAQDAPFGFIGIQNNINPLLESFGRLKQETGSTGAALKALAGSFLGPAGLGVAISLVTSAITFFIQSQQSASREAKELAKSNKGVSDGLEEIGKGLSKEFQRVTQLVSVLQTQNLARNQQKAALTELNKLAPEYFGNLNKEKDLVDKLATAYFLYTNSIINVFRAKAKEKELAKISDELLRVEEQIIRIEEIAKRSAIPKGNVRITNEKGQVETINTLYRNRFELQQKFASLTKDINSLTITTLKTTVDKTKETTDKSLEYKAAIEGVLSGYLANNAALAEQLKLQQQLNDLQRKFNELRKSGGLPNGLSNPNDQSNRSTAPRLFTNEDLELLQGIETKLINISDTINQGINGGIDTLFNALANNQDPFAALALSAKRLVFELGAAVVKALVLQGIANALTGGGAGAGRLFANAGAGLFKGTIRGSDLRLLTMLRG